MDRERVRTEFPLAAAAAVAGLAGAFALAGWSERFVVVPVDQFVIDATPAAIVNWTILTLGDAGHALHIGLALAAVLAAFLACGLVGREVALRTRKPGSGAAVGGGLVGLLSLALVGSVGAAVAAALPATGVLALPAFALEPSRSPSRRGVLKLAAGLVPAVGLAFVVGRRSASPVEGTDPLEGETESELIATADDRSLEVDGLDPLVTPTAEFFTIDIASTPPAIDPDRWRLELRGEVAEPAALSYDDLRGREAVRRFATLRCISDTVDGDLIDTAVWTGVPVAPLLSDADPGGDCECAMVHAEDGYFERFPLEALRRSLLVYGMNGRALPAENGSPVRLIVPGHWGKINVKWVSAIEVLEEPAEGYWEQRGWHGSGPVETVAKLSVADREDGRAHLAGHAYAGTRGVSGVEVSTDGGDSWTEADLSDPLPEADWPGADEGGPAEDVWRQWKYAFDAEPGTDYDVVVRAIEETGAVQPDEETDPFPSGASGWASRTI